MMFETPGGTPCQIDECQKPAIGVDTNACVMCADHFVHGPAPEVLVEFQAWLGGGDGEVYQALDEVVGSVFGEDPVLGTLAVRLADALQHALDHDPRLIQHERGWVIKKAHEVLGGVLDRAIQQPFNERLGMPRDFRG